MIAVGLLDAHCQEGTQPDSTTFSSFSTPSVVGDELPSLSCDLSDISISSSDIDQLLLHGLGDVSFPLDVHMQFVTEASGTSFHQSSQFVCDFTSSIFEDTPRPRDLNLSCPGEENVTPLFKTTPSSPQPAKHSACAAPIQSSGVVQQNLSRASSPGWSDSSVGITTNYQVDQGPSKNNPLPRHKRPSHKRAEFKRRDKIKACLDDIKDEVPSLRGKGKLSESTILSKAAEYVHRLKDDYTERGSKAAELRREIECLSAEIHVFQDNLPAAGLKEEQRSSHSLDELYQQWTTEPNQHPKKFFVFTCLTSVLFDTFKAVVGPATTMDDFTTRSQEWQAKYLSLPVLRKQILQGMLSLSRRTGILSDPQSLKLEINTGNS